MKTDKKAKYRIQLTVDGDVIDYHKAKGTNMSQEAEAYFRALMGKEENDPIQITDDAIKKLNEDLAKMKVERARAEALKQSQQKEDMKEALKLDVESMKVQFRKAEAEPNSWEASQYKKNFKVFKAKYKLGHKEAMDYACGIKEVD